jgi:asparagine synthase (glutamine-hydrolysing)
MRTIVPDAILDRRDKVGFSTPEYRWLMLLRPWVDDIFSNQVAKNIPVLNIPEMQQKWQLLLQGKESFDFCFWRWLNLIRWVDQQGIDFA